MNFIKEIVWGTLGWIWLLVTGLASLASWLDKPAALTTQERLLLIAALSSSFAVVIMLYRCYQLYTRVRAPVTVRKIAGGQHHYSGSMILILDRSNWINTEQILVLIQTMDDIQTPIALLRVETFTTKRYPQCVVLRSLTSENLPKYLSDSSRWASMSVVPEIRSRFLEDNTDVK